MRCGPPQQFSLRLWTVEHGDEIISCGPAPIGVDLAQFPHFESEFRRDSREHFDMEWRYLRLRPEQRKIGNRADPGAEGHNGASELAWQMALNGNVIAQRRGSRRPYHLACRMTGKGKRHLLLSAGGIRRHRRI